MNILAPCVISTLKSPIMSRVQWCVIAIFATVLCAAVLRSRTAYRQTNAPQRPRPGNGIAFAIIGQAIEEKDSSADTSDWRSPNFGSVKRVWVSPFTIARAVQHNHDLWTNHRIAEVLDLQEVWEELKIEGDGVSRCEGDVEARIFWVRLGTPPQPAILLKLTNVAFFCRYLLFMRCGERAHDGRGWLFLGSIDCDDNRYEESWHRVQPIGKSNWLMVRAQTVSGNVYQSYADTWYEVSKCGIRRVLQYTAKNNKGGWAPSGFGRDLRSEVHCSLKRPAIEVRFTLSYRSSQGEEYHPLFRKTRRVRFKWDRRQRRFIFSKPGSQVSRAEFEYISGGIRP